MLDFTLLSKYRTQLMGVAMLWVVLYHTTILIPIIGLIQSVGYLGVEIFFLVSGFGCYFSLLKDSSNLSFYKARMLRILPAYLPVVFLYSISLMYYRGCDWTVIAYNMTTLSFWMNIHWHFRFDWYIPCLLFLYFLAPLFYYYLNKNKVKAFLTVVGACLLLSLILSQTKFSYLLILTTRAPNFFLGMLIAFLLKKKATYSSKLYYVVGLFFCIGGLMLIFGNQIMTHFFLSPTDYYTVIYAFFVFLIIPFPLCLCFCRIFELVENRYSYNLKILSFLGIYSLPIYLFHEKIIFVLENNETLAMQRIGLNILAIFMTLIVAYFYQNLVQKIIAKF